MSLLDLDEEHFKTMMANIAERLLLYIHLPITNTTLDSIANETIDEFLKTYPELKDKPDIEQLRQELRAEILLSILEEMRKT